MIRVLIFLLAVAIHSTVFGQDKPEPTVLYLFPHQVTMTEAISKEVAIYDKEMEITDEVRRGYVQDNLSANWKTIRSKELEFVQKQDIATLLVLTLARELTYKEIENHENLLIYPVKETSTADRTRYKSLTDKYSMSWLVNITKLELADEGSVQKMVVTLQLYNAKTGWLFLDTSYTADSTQLGDAPCEEGIWYCLVQYIKNPIAGEVADKVDRNRHHHK